MRAAKGLRIKGWESWLGPTMDTWTGPREPIAKKILFPVVSGHLPSIAIAFDRISRGISPWTTVHHHIRTLTYLPYLYHSINSLRFSPSRNISFLFFFLFFFWIYSSFLTRIVCEIFATAERLERVLQPDYRYRVMIIISRNPWERDARTRESLEDLFPFFPSLEPVPLPELSCLSENNNLHNKQDE